MIDRVPSAPRLEEAMDWLLRLREAPDDPDLRREVEAWVAAAPDHRRAWEQARKAWQMMGEVLPATAGVWESGAVPIQEAAAKPAPGPAPGPAAARSGKSASGRTSPRGGRRRWAVAAIAAAAAACLALVFAPSFFLRLQADHVSATAEVRVITLEDGSVVHLAPESAIDLRFTTDRRTVALLAGDAFFDVVTDSERPFVVAAGELEARVIGTAFGVELSGGSISVEVASGTVGVTMQGAGPPVDERLGLGRTLRFDRATQTAILGHRPPGDVAAWRQGTLLVVDASIAEVVETLDRYHAGWIVIADDRLAARRVNGLYDLSNPDGALRALVQPAGGQVHEITPLLRVLR